MIPRAIQCGAMLLLCFATAVHGQAERRVSRRVPVTVALVTEMPQPGAPFLVQRRPGVTPHDVILLPDSVTASQLSEAVRVLLLARERGGDTAGTAVTLRLRPHQAHPGPPLTFPWAHRVIADLRRAERRTVPAVGNVRAVEIWLPPQRARRPPDDSSAVR